MFGGRLILLKSVLSSLPVYFLSIFKAPTGIISSIESIFKNFFWGGCEVSKKISWIKWDSICLLVNNGGLGVRRLREFNVSLLGKWCWRLLVDKDSLWYRVLKARYGEVCGRIQEGDRNASAWWRMMGGVREGIGSGVGNWFGENVERVVGDGKNTFFWTDKWLDGVPLKLRFSRLYELTVHKECTVEEMVRLGWEEEGNAWGWRRRLWAWEEDSMRECVFLVNHVLLQDNIQDSWRWIPDPIHGYSVRGAYRFLTSQAEPATENIISSVWHRLVPSKISLFAWRLLQDRILTKSKLVRRHILQQNDNICVEGCGFTETTNHLFIGCALFGNVWNLVSQWLGIDVVFPGSIKEHYLQFTQFAAFLRGTHSYFKIIWLACTWAI